MRVQQVVLALCLVTIISSGASAQMSGTLCYDPTSGDAKLLITGVNDCTDGTITVTLSYGGSVADVTSWFDPQIPGNDNTPPDLAGHGQILPPNPTICGIVLTLTVTCVTHGGSSSQQTSVTLDCNC